MSDRDFPPDKPQKLRAHGASDWLVQPGIGYKLSFPSIGTIFSLSRIRFEDGHTKGLLTVRVSFRGARTVGDGIVSSADFNCAVHRGRTERANHLRDRTAADDIDWLGLIEELCVRVLEAEENSELEQVLHQIALPDTSSSSELQAGGFSLVRHNPVIWFGDGGAGKSYLALYAAVDLAQQGHRVLYCDWECSGEIHRERLHRLVGPVVNLPQLWYLRCNHPLARETAKIQAVIARRDIQVVICDSVGYAAVGPPEASDAALGYFQALRAFGPITSLHLAHVNKSEQGDQKPFGSAFWHNSARSTWYLKRSDVGTDEEDGLTVGFYHRKANIGKLRPSFGVRLQFVGTETRVFQVPLTEPELAAKTSIRERMVNTLSRGAMDTDALAEEAGTTPATIRNQVKRFPDKFVRLPDGRIGLKNRG